jgi:hypothetical protein
MDRDIFEYEIEGKKLFGDPFEIDQRFEEACIPEDMETIDKWIDQVPRTSDGEIDYDKADRASLALYHKGTARYVPLIRAAFNLAPFDSSTGKGATAVECLELWTSFINWKFNLKKNTDTVPTSVKPTDSGKSSLEARSRTRPRTGST